MGPIPADEQSFLAIRAHYVVDTLIAITGDNSTAQAVASKEQHNIDTLQESKYQRIVLWVEHDGYDQFMLLRALQLLAEQRDTVIEIIELNHFPGSARFVGLGQLPPHAVRSLWQQRKPINARLTAQANTCWRALTSSNPKTLFDLLQQHPLDALPNIKGAIKRLLQELPHTNTGLSYTQQLALTLIAENGGNLTFRKLFPLFQEHDPLPTLGDLMFFALLLPLTQTEEPLLTLSPAENNFISQTLSLTQAGKSCLEGNNKIAQIYWVGGIQLHKDAQWCWDHGNLESINKV